MGRRNKKEQQNNQYYGNNQYYNQYYNQNGQYYDPNNQYYNQNGQYYDPNNQYYNQNNQYYDPNNQNYYQNQYSQYPQMNEKKKKKFKLNLNIDRNLLMGIILFVVFAIILIIAIFIINNSNDSNNNDDMQQKEEEPYYEQGLTMQVGSDEYGYVTVPSNWVKFVDGENVNSLQYSDIDASYIVTLNYTSTSQHNAKDFSTVVYNQFKDLGVINLSNTPTKINNYDGYLVSGYYQVNKVWVVMSIFEAEDGKTHYIGVEGADRQNEYFNIINTFKLTR